MRWIESEPAPDGTTRRAAPPPFRPDTIVAERGDLVVRYRIDAVGVVFLRVQRRTDLGSTP